jgi:transposase
VRELREQVRHRAKLVTLRAGLKAQVHAVLAKQGVQVRATDVFGVVGRAQLDKLVLGAPYRPRVNSLLRLIDAYGFEIDTVAARLRAQLADRPGYQRCWGFRGWVRCWPGSSTPRSARCTVFAPRSICARGPG